MDEFDVKILNIVQQDNRLSAERIAEQVGLSSSAVQRRLRHLRAAGVIEADVAVVSPEAAGLRLIAITTVTLERERPQLLEEFKRLMLATPEVMQCYYVTGDADFVLIVTARDMNEYEAVTRRLFVENPNVKRFHTNIMVSRVKSGLTIPITNEATE